jgi:hypothetical protein
MTVSLIDVSTYLPGQPIGADYYAQFAESDELRDNVMFRAPRFAITWPRMRRRSTWWSGPPQV